MGWNKEQKTVTKVRAGANVLEGMKKCELESKEKSTWMDLSEEMNEETNGTNLSDTYTYIC